MFVFNNIKLLLYLYRLGALSDTSGEFYVTEIALEDNYFNNVEKTTIREMEDNGIINIFSLGSDFFKFCLKQSIEYPGLEILDFASIFYAKINNGFLVSSNCLVKKCATKNKVECPDVIDSLANISIDKKYMEFIKNL